MPEGDAATDEETDRTLTRRSALETIAEAGRRGGIPEMGGIAFSGIDEQTSVTDRVAPWDAGTEPNDDPASSSPNQAPRQGLEFGNPGRGDDENGLVRQLRPTDNVGGGYSYPDSADAIDVTIAPE